MLIEAIVEKGQIRLLKPVQFKHDNVAVTVNIPDDEIGAYPQKIIAETQPLNPTGEVAEFMRLTDALFGEDYRYIPEKSDQEILAEVLSDKYA